MQRRPRVALIGVCVLAAFLSLIAILLYFAMSQPKPATIKQRVVVPVHVQGLSNAQLLAQLGSPQQMFDCGQMNASLAGLKGTAYIDTAKQRVVFVCVAPS